MYVPDYPGAREVQALVQEDPKKLPLWTVEPYKVVTFVTPDSSEVVFAFFRSDLVIRTLEGWRDDTGQQEPASFSMTGNDGSRIAPPIYSFHVTTKRKNGLTYVRVERYYAAGL